MSRASCIKSVATVTVVVVLALNASSCTTVATAEIDPLEDRAEILFGQVEFELQLTDVVLLNPYLEQESPRADDFDEARRQLVIAAEFLVDYSVALIDAARNYSDEDAVAVAVPLVRDLHSNLSELPIIGSRLNTVDVDMMLATAAGQKNLTRALRASAPIISEIADALRGSVDDVNGLFDLAFAETYDKIIDENRSFMTYTDNLVLRRNEILEKLLLLDEARDGDGAAWQALLDEDEELRQALGGTPAMTVASINRAESTIAARLTKIMEIWGDLEPSWTIYKDTLRELYEVDANVRNILKISKFIIEDWEKAQREMAKGRPAGFVQVTKDLAYLALKRASRR